MTISTLSMASKLLALCHLATFSSLLSLAFWDAYNIVNTYVVDNRVVAVKHVQIDGTFPFLRNTSQMCVMYQSEWFFEPFGHMSAENYSRIAGHIMMNRPPIDPVEWFGEVSLSDQNRSSGIPDQLIHDLYQLLLPYHVISNVDDLGPNATEYLAQMYGLDHSDFITLIDQFINSPQSIARVSENWSRLREFILKVDDKIKDDVRLLSIHPIHKTVCFALPLDKISVKGVGQQMYHLDYRNGGSRVQNGSFDINQILPRVQSISINIYPDTALYFEIDPSSDIPFTQTIQITNQGIFDSSRIQPHCTNLATSHQCQNEMERQIFHKVCNCTQVSQMLTTEAPSDWSLSSACTYSRYTDCFDRAKSAFDNRLSKAMKKFDQCQPCVTSKNSHKLLPYTFSSRSTNDWLPKIGLMFVCDEKSYLLFEEKPQFTLSQLISQIGGDFGLYVGFSMMSLLQLMAFVYQLRLSASSQKFPKADRKSSENGPSMQEPSDDPGRSWKSHWSQAIGRWTLPESFRDQEMRECVAKHDRELNELRENLKEIREMLAFQTCKQLKTSRFNSVSAL